MIKVIADISAITFVVAAAIAVLSILFLAVREVVRGSTNK